MQHPCHAARAADRLRVWMCTFSTCSCTHTHRFSHTHTDAHLMHIQTQSTDTQRDIYGGSRSSSPSVCASLLVPMIGLIKQIMTGYKQWRLCFCIMSASVGTKWKPLWCFHPQSGRIAPMLFRLYLPHHSPPTSSLCPAQRVEPAQHHQRNITSLSSQPQVNSDWVPRSPWVVTECLTCLTRSYSARSK